MTNTIAAQTAVGILPGLAQDPKVIQNARETIEKQQAVVTEFESMFISTMIKQMRETLEDGLFTKETSDSFGALSSLTICIHHPPFPSKTALKYKT